MQKELIIAEKLAKLLDNQFQIGRFKFGLDPILGLIPGLGDTVALLFASYIILLGFRFKLPARKIIQMTINVGLDYVIGIIPLIGDLLDFTIKPSSKNLEIIKNHLQKNSL